jgi:hypothetical protein
MWRVKPSGPRAARREARHWPYPAVTASVTSLSRSIPASVASLRGLRDGERRPIVPTWLRSRTEFVSDLRRGCLRRRPW